MVAASMGGRARPVPADGEQDRQPAALPARVRRARARRRASRSRRARSCPRSSTRTTSSCSRTRASRSSRCVGATVAAPIAALDPEDGRRPVGVARRARSCSSSGRSARSASRAPRRSGGAETVDEREALHARSIVIAGTAMGLLRGVVGFFTFFAAFALKRAHEPAWVFGLVLIGERGRQRSRNGDRAVPAAQGAGGVDARGRVAASRVAARARGARLRPRLARVRGRARSPPRPRAGGSRSTASCSATVRSRCAGRAFARFETRFQLVWVAGGVVAVLFPGGGRGGIFVVAVVLLFAGLSYVGAFRRTPRVARTIRRDAAIRGDRPPPG